VGGWAAQERGSEMEVVVFEDINSGRSGFDSECHAKGCSDVAKKIKYVDRVYYAASIEEAKEIYESGNADFEEESGEGAGYYWDYHVKVYGCVKAAEDKKFVDDHFKIVVVS